MTDPIRAYPLQWPPGWKRTNTWQRTSAKFRKGSGGWVGDEGSRRYQSAKGLTIADGLARVLGELGRMGVSRDDIVISTNAPLRLDGMPKSNAGSIGDPGAAVYWRQGKATRCMAIDRYDALADNLAAIAATLDAMRAIERHGGAEILDRAFTGFTALPAPEQPWQVLGVQMTASREEIETAYRRLAMQHHPDRGGDAGQMARVNAARDAMNERSHQL